MMTHRNKTMLSAFISDHTPLKPGFVKVNDNYVKLEKDGAVELWQKGVGPNAKKHDVVQSKWTIKEGDIHIGPELNEINAGRKKQMTLVFVRASNGDLTFKYRVVNGNKVEVEKRRQSTYKKFE